MRRYGAINVDDSIQSGQVFLWKKIDDVWYGVNGQDVLRVDDTGKTRSLSGTRTDFFRTRDDMAKIVGEISKDAATKAAVRRFSGLRLTEQDPFQCLISFIASSNSNIQKIKTCLERMSARFGGKTEFEGIEFFLFPEPEALADASVNEIEKCGVGYRSGFIKAAAETVASSRINFEELRRSDYLQAKKTVCDISGVGDKVADCIMLFSLDKLEAFPLDRWMIRVLDRNYAEFSLKTKTITQKQYALLHEKIVARFGQYAGYAQQYLFKMERESLGKAWL